jgi:hypothetical protein
MDLLRSRIERYREQQEAVSTTSGVEVADEGEVRQALDTLGRISSDLFPNARGELREFLSHPEVISFLNP